MVIVLAVLLGIIAGGGVAWATWSAIGRAQAPPPLASGDLDMVVNGVAQGPNTPYTLSISPGYGYFPGATMAQLVHITNDGDAAFTVSSPGASVFSVVSLPASAQDGRANFAATLVWGGAVQDVSGRAGSTECTGGSVDPVDTAVVPASETPGPGETSDLILCVQVSYAPDATQDQQGATYSFTVPLAATQVNPAVTP
jgi:hypothetical protein